MLHINTDLCKNISCTASSKPNPLLVSYKLFKILSPHRMQKDLHTVSCESKSVCSQQGDKPSWWGLGFFLFKAGLSIKEDLASVPAVTSQHGTTAELCLGPTAFLLQVQKGKRPSALPSHVQENCPSTALQAGALAPRSARGYFRTESARQVQCPRSWLWTNTSPLGGSLRATPANVKQSVCTTLPTISVLVPLSIPLGHTWLAPTCSPDPLLQMTPVPAPWIPRQHANCTEGSAHQVPCRVLYSDTGKPFGFPKPVQ